jgi:hypothetical protein
MEPGLGASPKKRARRWGHGVEWICLAHEAISNQLTSFIIVCSIFWVRFTLSATKWNLAICHERNWALVCVHEERDLLIPIVQQIVGRFGL